MMKVTKWHVLRIAFCSVMTILIFKLASVMQTLYNYMIARWMLDVIELELPVMDFNLLYWLVLFWNFFMANFIVIVIWKFVGLPEKVYHGLFSGLMKYMFPKYNYGEDEDESK